MHRLLRLLFNLPADRIYRKRCSKEKLISELELASGKQLDPRLTQVALELIKNGMVERVNGETDSPKLEETRAAEP